MGIDQGDYDEKTIIWFRGKRTIWTKEFLDTDDYDDIEDEDRLY
jgi:hypothetical protein